MSFQERKFICSSAKASQTDNTLPFILIFYDNVLFSMNNFCYNVIFLCVENFDCLFACVDPYISAIIYPNCKTHQQRKLTKRTELMCFMTICRLTLHLGITGYMTGTSALTQSRIFTASAVFLSTLPQRGSLSFTSGILCTWLPGHTVVGRLHRELDCFTEKL